MPDRSLVLGGSGWDPGELPPQDLVYSVGLLDYLTADQELSVIASLSVMENLFIGDYRAGAFGLINRRALAAEGQTALAGETVLADLKAADATRTFRVA